MLVALRVGIGTLSQRHVATRVIVVAQNSHGIAVCGPLAVVSVAERQRPIFVELVVATDDYPGAWLLEPVGRASVKVPYRRVVLPNLLVILLKPFGVLAFGSIEMTVDRESELSLSLRSVSNVAADRGIDKTHNKTRASNRTFIFNLFLIVFNRLSFAGL